jgi:hypothetical protein
MFYKKNIYARIFLCTKRMFPSFWKVTDARSIKCFIHIVYSVQDNVSYHNQSEIHVFLGTPPLVEINGNHLGLRQGSKDGVIISPPTVSNVLVFIFAVRE